MCDPRGAAVKTLLHAACHLLWVAGVLVGLSGVYLLMKVKQSSWFLAQPHVTMPAFWAFASSALLAVSAYLGSWLSSKDSKRLQALFVYLLVVVFCVESTAAALAYFHSLKVESGMGPLTEVFQNYTGSSQDPNSRAVDATQEKLQCCGVRDYTDWTETSWFKQTGGLAVPHSCCNSTFPSCNGTVTLPQQLYTQGCQVKLATTIRFALRSVVMGCAVVLVMEVVLLSLVAQLMIAQPSINYQFLRSV